VCFCLTGFGQKEKLFLGIDYIPAMTTEFNSPATAPNIFRFSSSFGVNLYYKFKYSPLYLESGFYSIDRGYGYTVKAINANGELFGKYRKKTHNYYISIPIQLGFKFNNLYLDFGPSFNYLVAQRIKHDKKIINETPISIPSIAFGSNLSFGMNYTPKQNQSIKYMAGIYASYLFKPQYLNAGLKIGIKFRLK
jgi:hypothetical protein